jgi:hypothetical protein
MNRAKTRRRETALERLRVQLALGLKNTSDFGSVPLTLDERARIKAEIATLEGKV